MGRPQKLGSERTNRRQVGVMFHGNFHLFRELASRSFSPADDEPSERLPVLLVDLSIAQDLWSFY